MKLWLAATLVVGLLIVQLWPRPLLDPGQGYFVATSPAGAEVYQKAPGLILTRQGTTSVTQWSLVGRAPGPLLMSPSESHWTLRFTLWGWRERTMDLARDRFDSARRWPEPVQLQPAVPVLVPLVYLARDYGYLLAALGVVAWVGLSQARERRQARANEARLARGELSPGAILHGYRLEALLGQGGMARVFQARRVDSPRSEPVALKVLFRQLGQEDEVRREVQIARNLRHPRLVHLLDWGESAGYPYVVWELVSGQTLERRLEQGPVSLDQALEWACGVAEGLAYLHRAGIVHRDVKPSNIILTPTGVRLIDFGIAARADLAEATLAGLAPGTAGYTPLEQWHGQAVWQSDLFALGAMLYRLLAGRLPYEAPGVPCLLARQQAGEYPALGPEVPEPVARLVARFLSRDPQERATEPDEPLAWLQSLRADRASPSSAAE